MQRSLTETVTLVREGSDAIYSGTSEIASGNTISHPVLNNRRPRWKRRQPAWNS
jgi:hypothetical protein